MSSRPERRTLDRETVDAYAERLAAYEPRAPRAPRRAFPDRPEDPYDPRPEPPARSARRARSAASGVRGSYEAVPRGYRFGPQRDPRPRRRKPSRPRATRRRLPLRRILAPMLAVVLGYALISYTSEVLLAPSNVPVGIRSVEWLRGHGFTWLVNDVENVYYSLNAPKKGGPPLKRLPQVGIASAISRAAIYQPPPIPPVIKPALPGEGAWHRAGPLVAGSPPVLVATFRTDPSYPQLVAGVAWIDHTRTSVRLYPGRYEPPAGSPRGPMEVPHSLRAQLVATFNSGFKLEDSPGSGFVAGGHVYAPLHRGLATLVGTSDGALDVRSWQGGPAPPANVAFARQNLPLIVEGAHLNPDLSDGPEWGATLGNKVRVWRSAVGVDGHGNLIYAAADDQTVSSIAEVMRRAGAVRAMELDINYEWVSFNTYSWFGGGPSKLLPGMDRVPTRYLSPDDRDFFAVYANP